MMSRWELTADYRYRSRSVQSEFMPCSNGRAGHCRFWLFLALGLAVESVDGPAPGQSANGRFSPLHTRLVFKKRFSLSARIFWEPDGPADPVSAVTTVIDFVPMERETRVLSPFPCVPAVAAMKVQVGIQCPGNHLD